MAIIYIYDPENGDTSAEPVGVQNPFPVRVVVDPPTLIAAPMAATQQPAYLMTNIVTQATTVVKTGGGILHAITFNKPLAAGVVAFYDGLSAASGILKGTITFPATLLTDVGTYLYDGVFLEGLTIVTSGATQDLTVSYI